LLRGSNPTEVVVSFELPFFEASAQLIPVFFLAMVVEERLRPDLEESPGDRVMRSWMLALLVVGEVVSLAVLAGGINPTKGAGSIVVSSLVMAGFLAVVTVLSRELKDERSHAERLGHASAAVAVICVLVATLVAVQLS